MTKDAYEKIAAGLKDALAIAKKENKPRRIGKMRELAMTYGRKTYRTPGANPVMRAKLLSSVSIRAIVVASRGGA